MKTDPGPYPDLIAMWLGMLLVLTFVARSCLAHGQDVADDATTLALARVCFSERDVHTETSDCAAIAEVTRNRAAVARWTLLQQLRAYSPEATGARATTRPRLRWVSQLQLDGVEPAAWVEMNRRRVAQGQNALPWRRTRRSWMRTVEEARSLLVEPRRVCAEVAFHWGGHMDGVPRTWRVIDCGTTRNLFYTVPDDIPAPRRRVIDARIAAGDDDRARIQVARRRNR